ncbi:MAG TPA: hypothetical protein VFS77_02420 [Pyrinomonadaceae bacterium]|nr:hypothetical protein [Pyrinomonadaceae bacterium]
MQETVRHRIPEPVGVHKFAAVDGHTQLAEAAAQDFHVNPVFF